VYIATSATDAINQSDKEAIKMGKHGIVYGNRITVVLILCVLCATFYCALDRLLPYGRR
jgi:hypothetical protein